MIINDRKEEINSTEGKQVQNNSAVTNPNETDQQPVGSDLSVTASDQANESDQEGWVAVGSGLGIDE